MFWICSICCISFCLSASAEHFNFRGPGGFNVVGPFPYGLPLQAALVVTFSRPDLPPPRDDFAAFSTYRVNVYANGANVYFACGSNQSADCGYRHTNVADSFSIPESPPFVLTENLTIDVASELSTPDGPSSLPVHVGIDLPDGYRISRVPEYLRRR
jgi:hypothetical protein